MPCWVTREPFYSRWPGQDCKQPKSYPSRPFRALARTDCRALVMAPIIADGSRSGLIGFCLRSLGLCDQCRLRFGLQRQLSFSPSGFRFCQPLVSLRAASLFGMRVRGEDATLLMLNLSGSQLGFGHASRSWLTRPRKFQVAKAWPLTMETSPFMPCGRMKSPKIWLLFNLLF